MAPQHLHGQGLEHVISCFSESASEREMGISVIYFHNFQYSKAGEQRRVDPVVRTGPKSVLALSRMSSAVRFISGGLVLGTLNLPS